MGKEETFLPKCVFNYSFNKDEAKPGKCKIITGVLQNKHHLFSELHPLTLNLLFVQIMEPSSH